MDGSFERDSAQPQALAPAPEKNKGLSPGQKRLALMIVPPLVIVAVAAAWIALTAGYVSTDNAQISAARAPISSSVRARVTDVLVTENQDRKSVV